MSATASLDLDTYAPVRAARTNVTTPLTTIPKPTSEQLTVAIQTITDTGWITSLQALLPRRVEGTGGRQRTVTLEAFLTAALCLPLMSRSLFVRDIARLLDKGLDQPTRRRLGLAKNTRVTERMVPTCTTNSLPLSIPPATQTRTLTCLTQTSSKETKA